jgi:hypothetical protein
MQSSPNTLVVFCAQGGPLITRRLDQLPVAPSVGVVFNFDSEFLRQEEPPIVCIGRTAGGKSRDLNLMLLEALSLNRPEADVVEILMRRIISYTVPDAGGSTIIQITDKLESGCSDLMFLLCKRFPRRQQKQQEGGFSLVQLVAAATGSSHDDVAVHEASTH